MKTPMVKINKEDYGRSGQALLELAVFSTIFLMILTAVVAYGMRYSFNQRAQQLAFRRAMKIASDKNYGSGSYMLIQERHLPDFSDPFGIGSSMPFTASANIVRTYELDAQAETEDSLPANVIDIEAVSENGVMEPAVGLVLKSAAFRYENGLPDTEDDEDKPELIRKYDLIYDGVIDQNGGNYKIIDSCVAEMVDYSACYQQAMKIVDVETCTRHCRVSVTEDEDTNCSSICGQVMNPPNQNNRNYDPSRGGAWYAANYRVSGGVYTFPVLDEVFERIGSAGAKTMGLQFQTTVSESTRDTSIRKIETTQRIVTEERADWQDKTTRSLAILNNLNSQGEQINHDNPMAFADAVEVSDIESSATGRIRQTFTTPK
ncbi:MAG: TadE family protein [Candidatus Omnitrophota bacterium]